MDQECWVLTVAETHLSNLKRIVMHQITSCIQNIQFFIVLLLSPSCFHLSFSIQSVHLLRSPHWHSQKCSWYFCSLLQPKVQKSWRADLYLWDDAHFDCGISIFPSHTTFLSYFPFSLFVRSFVWLKAELSVDFVPTWQELWLAMALCICHNFGVAVLNWEISALNEFLQNRT